MPQHIEPVMVEPSQIQNPQKDASRRLSRSPHPYHRHQSELPHGSESFEPNGIVGRTHAKNPENDTRQSSLGQALSYREATNSDSGTDADDEHFLKGLPAPKLRSHKGLRGAELSGSPSPVLSPALLEEGASKSFGKKHPLSSAALTDDVLRKVAEKLQERRRVEILRRSTEVGLIAFVGGMLCLDTEVRSTVYLWRKELLGQFLVTSSLMAVYPLRLQKHLNSSTPFAKSLISLPPSFDPAPLIYPPLLSMLVVLFLSKAHQISLLPTIILGIASLPRELVPAVGGLQGANQTQWLLASLPLLLTASSRTLPIKESVATSIYLSSEVLVLVPPLHHALCATLSSLTTTSLLPAELQLLSISMINLLLFAMSPQMIILKSLLWIGGVGVLVTCTKVLRWGVALARVPKWRLKRTDIASPEMKSRESSKKPFYYGPSLFSTNSTIVDSSDEEGVATVKKFSPNLKLDTKDINAHSATFDTASFSAVESKQHISSPATSNSMADPFRRIRRNTLPSLSHMSAVQSSTRTPSGRRKRTVSTSVQSFFSLTQAQATARKWIYAAYVYLCTITIILGGIREYVKRYALSGDEPIGWALAYLFGDLPWFRMQVVYLNLQRWIGIPPRSTNHHLESCHRGWVEHIRHASFGEGNTRLILSCYWLMIIIVGLAIVLRLSSIYEVDTRRKVFHFMMVAMLLPATYVDPAFAALSLSLMLAIFLLLDLFRASQLPPLSKSLAYFLTPYVDGRDLKGPVVISHIFLLIGCAIPLWLSLASLPRTGSGHLAGWELPSREVSMVSGVICVGMGDAAASLIGRRWGRHKWIWGGGKSIEGSVAFAFAVASALVLAKAWLKFGGWYANNSDTWDMTVGKVGLAATLASLTEAVLTGGNDNVVVPIVLWLCCKGLDI